jgi:hypothetical protein
VGIQRDVESLGKIGGQPPVGVVLILNFFEFVRTMNFTNWINGMSQAGCAGRVCAGKIIFGQTVRESLKFEKSFMFLPFARRVVISCCWGLFLMIAAATKGQTNFYAQSGTEYAVIGAMIGDQMFPDAAITPAGGYVVWQDNATDGSGWGISARRLDSTLSGTLGSFRVNQIGTNDQVNPRVAMLKNGGAAFVWQGGTKGSEHIFVRFLTPTNTFLTTTDEMITAFGTFQITPAVATLNDSNVVVAWASFDQAGSNSLQDVYFKILNPTSKQFPATATLVNQFTNFNQRTPSVAALKNGGFVVVWVSEQERTLAPNWGSSYSPSTTAGAMQTPSVDIYARLFNSNGVPVTGEFLVNTDSNSCANPAVTAAADGSFMVAWDAHDMVNLTNGYDIYARTFSSTGVGGTTLRVNSFLAGDQYAPRLSVIGSDYMIVWTSLGQDGSLEGVFGQFVHEDGTPVGGEFQVNTTTVSRQIQPVVTSDGVNQFLVAWSSYTGSPYGFDLFAQRYLSVAALLEPMAVPFVYAPFTLDTNGVYQPQLQVSWPPLLGISVSNYQVFVDGSGVPAGVTTGNSWTMTASNGLAVSSTHSFQLEYVTTSGTVSPISPAASGTTWSGGNYYGVPIEWVELYYGNSIANWPASVSAPLGPGGLNLRQVFLSGGNPLDPSTWLRTALSSTSQGMFLNWNTQAGATYQVQSSPDLMTWTNLGVPRFAAGVSDSINVGGSAAGYYRVLLLRQ